MSDFYNQLVAQDAAQPGGAPAAPVQPSFYDALKVQDAEDGRLRASVSTAVKVSPDTAAQHQRLAATTGLPLAVVQTNEGEAKARAQYQEISELAKTSPVLKARLMDPTFTAVAQDDSPTLSALSKALRGFFDGQKPELKADGAQVLNSNEYSQRVRDIKTQYNVDWDTARSMAANGMTLSNTTERAGNWTAPPMSLSSWASGKMVGFVQGMEQVRQGLNRQYADATGNEAMGDKAQLAALRSRNQVELNMPRFSNSTAQGLDSGVDSLLQNLPGMTASLLTANPFPALASMGVQSESTAYTKYRDRGASGGMALLGAAGEGATEVATELLPMKAVVDKLGKVGFSGFMKEFLGKEMAGEQINTAINDAIDTAIANPDKTWSQYLAERPGAAWQTALAVLSQSGLMAAGSHVLSKTAMAQQASDFKVQQAETSAAQLQQTLALAAQSKLRERSPGTFAELSQQMAVESKAPTEVRFDAKTLGEVLNQEDLAKLPSVAPQLREALATGGEVTIPMGEFMAAVAGTPLEQKLVEHARVGDAELSSFEAKEASAQAETYLQEQATRILEQAKDNGVTQASANAVTASLTEQLTKLGRFTADVNNAYATVATNMYVALASRLGITPEQAYAKYGMTINGVNPATQDVLNSRALPTGVTVRQTPVGFEALDANGKTIGKLESNITPEQSKQINESASVDIVKVDDANKGKGVGSALYSAWEAAHEGRITPSGKTSLDAWKLWKRNYPDKVAEFVQQEAGRIAGGASAEQVLSNVTDPEIKQAIADAAGYAQAVTPTKYQSKYLGDRDVSMLTPEERAQYNALGASPVLNQPKGSTARGTFNPKTLTISLLENADLSTFHHEMGHFYLEVLMDAASQPGAPASIVGDVETLFKWFGVKDLDTWNKMTLSEKRASHEKFAEGYEAYLFEGKSPNLEMQTLFQRFASWMKNVYKSLSEFMVSHGTQLTDEVRGVYDRMLATEAQIEQAEAARNYAPLFKSAEQAGMTPEAWSMYQLHGQEATEDAITELQARSLRDMRWTANAKARALKDLTKDAEAKRKGVEAEVRAEVAAQPVYEAWNALRSKEGPKLETLALEELYGAGERGPDYDRYGLLDWRRLVDQKMTAKDGVHPDVVAEQFGFSSGDEMIRKMLDAEPQASVVDGMTDQRMLERYGDLSTPAALEAAANKAVHNEARAKFVATELNAISKANKPTSVLLKAAKQFAEGLVAQRKVRDLKPGQHTAAETRASKNAEKAMAKGDTQGAIIAKRDQLLQFYAAKLTNEAQTEVDKKVDAIKKLAVNDKLPIEYRDQIDKLLERVDLKNKTLRELDKRAKLADWLKSQEEMGLDPEIPDYLREDSQLTSYKDMTVEEFRGLYDTLKQIEHLGRLKNKLLTSKDKREFHAIRDDIANSISTLAGDRKANPRTATTKGGRWLQAVKDFGSAHIKAATWARVMDGGKDGGKVWEYFVRAANEQGAWETTQRSDATEKLTNILEPWLKKGSLSKQTFFPSINRSLTRQEVFAMALNSGNESNLQRLLGGEGWAMSQLEPVLATLDKADWAVVQKVWDHMESYWPEIEAKNLRVYGKRLEKVATGSSVTDALGLRGGYYPVKYDPRASIRAEEHADAESAQRQLKGAFNAATTRRSFTKARADEVNGRPLLYNLSGLYSGVNDVIHDLAWHEWLIDTNRLLKSTAIDTAIRSHYGDAAARQLKTWRDAVAEGDTGSQEALDSALGYLRQSVSVAGLGFNVVSAAMQPIGITNSISRVGAKWIGKGVAAYIASPIAQTKEAQEKSAFMANRARTQFRDLNELRNRVQGEDTVMNSVRKNAYFLMMQAQRMVDVPTWHGAYEKAISEGNDERRAVALADQAVIDSQGGGETKDLAAIERGGPAQKLFTAFYSFMNTVANLGYTSARTKGGAKKATDILLLGVLPAILPVLLKDALTPGSSGDDDWKKLTRKLLGEQLSYLMGLMVVSREFAEAGKTLTGTTDHPRDYSGPAGVRMVSDAGTFAKQAYQGELDDAFRKAAINLAGDVIGLPSAQLNRTITGVKALKEGKTNNPMAILMGYQEPK